MNKNLLMWILVGGLLGTFIGALFGNAGTGSFIGVAFSIGLNAGVSRSKGSK